MGETELLIAPDFASVPGHPAEPLFEDSFSCLVCQDYPVRGSTLTANQYFAAGHVGVEWGGGRRQTFDARLLAVGRRARRQEVIAPNFMLVADLLVGTHRIATLPTRLAVHMAERLPLRVVKCPVAIPGLVEKLQWHKHQERDPAIVWLRELLHAVARELPAPGRSPKLRPDR